MHECANCGEECDCGAIDQYSCGHCSDCPPRDVTEDEDAYDDDFDDGPMEDEEEVIEFEDVDVIVFEDDGSMENNT